MVSLFFEKFIGFKDLVDFKPYLYIIRSLILTNHMKVVVVKDQKESNERLITRFNKTVQKSRKVMKVRATRYNKKDPTKRMVRAAAVVRDMYRAKKEKNKFY